MKTIYTCFPNGTHKVLTMSYDDGKEEDRRLLSLFNQYGIRGTFHINSGLLHHSDRIGTDELPELLKGHEVACHTFTHPTIARCPMEFLVRQIMDDRSQLERIMKYPVRGLSYPNGSYTDAIKEILPKLGIRYARIVGNSNQFDMPHDYFEWKATCHHNHNLLNLGQQFLDLTKRQYLYLMYVWGHSYEFTLHNNWDLIENFCKLMGSRSDIWYATNIEIVDYMEAANRLQFASDLSFVYNPSFQSVYLSVADEIIKVPGGTQVNLDL